VAAERDPGGIPVGHAGRYLRALHARAGRVEVGLGEHMQSRRAGVEAKH
jgi:hypothetical protein